jgi:hypothetical protein
VAFLNLDRSTPDIQADEPEQQEREVEKQAIAKLENDGSWHWSWVKTLVEDV